MLENCQPFRGIAWALLLAACGDQASTEYRGEPLLTFAGRVQLLEGSGGEPLVPTLAFRGTHEWHVMDVDVEGEFPASFVLRVFAPPPEEVLVDNSSFGSGEPRMAAAFIAASPLDHEVGFLNANSYAIYSDCSGSSPCRRVRVDMCRISADRAESFDGFDEAFCYAEIRECDFEIDWDLEQEFDGCTVVEAFGDAALAERPRFRGFARFHTVIYLESEAPENSFVARTLGRPEGVAAGYHVVEQQPRSAAEQEDADACNDAAAQLGIERWLAANPELGCSYTPPSASGSGFVACDGDDTEVNFTPDVLQAQVELGCPSWGDSTLRIVDTMSSELAIEIGPEPVDLGFGP